MIPALYDCQGNEGFVRLARHFPAFDGRLVKAFATAVRQLAIIPQNTAFSRVISLF